MIWGRFAIVLVVMVTSRHLSYRISEGCSERTDWNKNKNVRLLYVFCIICMSLLYLGQTWSAWVHSLCTDMRQCWWWWDDMGDVSGVRPSWELRSWHSRHPPSRPGRQPPSVCGKFQTEPTALYIVYYVLLVLHYIVGPGKHNNQPDLFWLLSCSQKYKININLKGSGNRA